MAISTKKKYIYDGDKKIEAKNINGYLIDAPNAFVESRKQQLFDVPSMVFGNMPNDGGNLILTEEEKDKLIKNDPKVSKFIKLFLGAEQFISNNCRKF